MFGRFGWTAEQGGSYWYVQPETSIHNSDVETCPWGKDTSCPVFMKFADGKQVYHEHWTYEGMKTPKDGDLLRFKDGTVVVFEHEKFAANRHKWLDKDVTVEFTEVIQDTLF